MDDKYETYLKSRQWKEKRNAVLARDLYKCQLCGATENLAVHHLTYEHIYEEPMCDLITVCDKCHKDIHTLTNLYDDFSTRKDYYLHLTLRNLVLNELKNRDVAFGGDMNFQKNNNGIIKYVEKLIQFTPASGMKGKTKKEEMRNDLWNGNGFQKDFQNLKKEKLKEVWQLTHDMNILRKLGAGSSFARRIKNGEWD